MNISLTGFFLLMNFLNPMNTDPEESTHNFERGNPAIQSIGALEFGPDGVLFLGDSKGNALVAIQTGDITLLDEMKPIDVLKVDQKISGLLGKPRGAITINDMAVNPLSKNIYFSIHIEDPDQIVPVLIKMNRKGELSTIQLSDIKFYKVPLKNTRETNLLSGYSVITDIAFIDGHVYFSGLSNQEFSSVLRKIAFPFKEKNALSTSIEVFHANHSKYETHAPITAMTPVRISDETQIVASYACTPLVLFSTKSLVGLEKVRGKTVADLGPGNVPIDMVHFNNEELEFLLITNYHRNMMMIPMEQVRKANDMTLESKEKESSEMPEWERKFPYQHFGVDYIDVSKPGAMHISKLSENQALFLTRDLESGYVHLQTRNSPWFYMRPEGVIVYE